MHVFLSLLGVIVLGLITSYEDIKYGKIRNKYILSAIVYSIIVNIFITYTLIGDETPLSPRYYPDLLLNVVLALLTAFILWTSNIWSPGDGKLFVAYSALVPLSIYEHGYIEYLPSLMILVNTFIPLMLLIFLSLIFHTSLAEKAEILTQGFKPERLFGITLVLFGFIWLIYRVASLFSVLNITFNIFVAITFLYLLYKFLNYLLSTQLLRPLGIRNIIHISLILSIAALILDFSVVSSQAFQTIFFSFVILAVLIIQPLSYGGFFITTTPVDINRLEPGMAIAEKIVRRRNRYMKERIQIGVFDRFKSTGRGEDLLEYDVKGLSEQDIGFIRSLRRDNKIDFNTLRIQQTIPFAPPMLFGVILTYISRGNFVVALFLYLPNIL